MELLTPPLATLLAGFLAGLLSNAGAWLLLRRQGKKLSSETLLAGATAAEKLDHLATDQLRELEGLRERIEELESLLEDERRTTERLEEELKELRVEVRMLRGC